MYERGATQDSISTAITPKYPPPMTPGNSSASCLSTRQQKNPIISPILSQSPQTIAPWGIVKLGDESMHQFNAGEVVTCIPDMFLRHAAPGGYKILGRMPDRDGDHMYRIKSPLEDYERVVKETALVRSDCDLPDEILVPRPRRRAITLASSISI